MEPLDLTGAPPRAPRAALGGVIFLPRTIDKVRASLPGGAIGLYYLTGFSASMLEMLGIDLADLTKAVADAKSDEDVLAFVQGATTPEKIVEWNDWCSHRKPRNGDREAVLQVFPWLADREEIPLALDAIAEDDQRLFA